MNEVKFEVYRSITKKETPHCFHRRAELDEQTRTLECAECGAILDPFQFVLVMALEERSVQMNVARLKKELAELSKEYDSLKKQVTYMKRKANSKPPAFLK